MSNANSISWTYDRIKFLKDNYSKLSNKELAKTLGLGLTSTRTKLYDLGLKRIEMEYFTDEQIAFLKSNYQTMGDVEIAEYFEENFKN